MAKSYYPINLDIAGKKCVVLGGGKVAERKAKTLLKFGGKVTIIAPKFTSGISAMSKDHNVRLVNRKYKACDTDGAILAIAATDDGSVNHKISTDSKRKKVLVNVVDVPSLCSFIAPSVIKRGPVVISISTSGQAPALARDIRKKLEKIISPDIGSLAIKLGKIRRGKIGTAPGRH